MKKAIFLFSLPLVIFLVFLALSFSKKSGIDTEQNEIHNLENKFNTVSNDLEIEALFSNDLVLAKNDFNQLVLRGNAQVKFWKEFINEDLNIAFSHSAKSSSSVNTEINKLLSYLGRAFENRNIKLGALKQSEELFFNPNTEKQNKFGFGFVSYDGFWPSFSKNEANVIIVQAKIIKELCEFLLSSYESPETFTLSSIKREAAGPEDKKHIGVNLYTPPNHSSLLRDSNLADSYVFEISFTGKTKNCRTFINQLRPPYSLRSLRVSRLEKDETEKIVSTDQQLDVEQPDILPIIRDISSQFVLEIEYVTNIDTNLNEEISKILPVDSDAKKVQEFLAQFN